MDLSFQSNTLHHGWDSHRHIGRNSRYDAVDTVEKAQSVGLVLIAIVAYWNDCEFGSQSRNLRASHEYLSTVTVTLEFLHAVIGK